MALQYDKTKVCHTGKQGAKGTVFFGKRVESDDLAIECPEAIWGGNRYDSGRKCAAHQLCLPSLLSLSHYLERLNTKVTFLRGLVKAFQASLEKRFREICINMRMDNNQDEISAPFSDSVYLKAAGLDPVFTACAREHCAAMCY